MRLQINFEHMNSVKICRCYVGIFLTCFCHIFLETTVETALFIMFNFKVDKNEVDFSFPRTRGMDLESYSGHYNITYIYTCLKKQF